MVDTTLSDHNQKLCHQLAFLIASSKPISAPPLSSLPVLDVIVSYDEINSNHGTGVLIQKIFRDHSALLTIRSLDLYGGQQSFGEINFRLPGSGMNRAQIFETVLSWVRAVNVNRVLCVPFAASDVVTAIAVKEITNADLCVYIMDDQNINKGLIPDDVMREALVKARLRLVISPEMQYAYQNKYRLKFWVLPPLVNHQLIRRVPSSPASNPNRGVLVGNVSSQHWLKLLRETIRSSGIRIDWYCNNGAPWLSIDSEEMKCEGITLHPGLPEEKLASALDQYSFALVPSGTLDEKDDHYGIAQLSLPSRIPFILATGNTPVIVIGNPTAAAARFVTRFQIGTICEYTTQDFQHAVRHVTNTETQRAMRERAAQMAPVFSDLGAADWLWQALKDGEPPDLKFEDLLAPRPGDFVHYVDPAAPDCVYLDFRSVYQSLRRLKNAGFTPDFVLDVGASTGIWSKGIKHLFPNARFILVEALASRYSDQAKSDLARYSDFELVEVAVSNKTGTMSFQVSSDLYNSSLLQVNQVSDVKELVDIDVTTLDRLAEERNITGHGMLKIDVQYAEHLVIEGGRTFIGKNVDVIAIELTLERVHPEMRTFDEMIGIMSELGFRYFDDVGEWRTPATGLLEQKDALFVRCGLF